jgi:hypothetical protein
LEIQIAANFSLDDLLARMREGESNDLSAYHTTEEWRGLLGVGECKMHTLLTKAKRLGLLRVARRPGAESIAGTRYSQLVYAFDLKGENP